MPKWSDFGNIWTTLRELDVNAIRDEAERPLRISIVGHDTALNEIDRMLHSGPNRYPAGPNPLELIPLAQAPERASAVNQASMLILAIDARNTLTPAEVAAFSKLEALALPFLVVLLFADRLPVGETSLPPAVNARMIAIADPYALNAADQLATAFFTRLPSELHLSAARRLSGLRGVFARELIGSVSFSNAAYALASGLPEQIPIMNVPFAAADILILTKNQALLVYKLALAYGAQADFQARIREVLPVIGGAFLWRQAARSLIGLIPVWGLVPKVAISYAGTYTTGIAAWRWYDSGEIVSAEQIKRISSEAIAIGRKRAAEMIERARTARSQVTDRVQEQSSGLLDRAKRVFTRRKRPELPPQE